jgi:hypothetical protein
VVAAAHHVAQIGSLASNREPTTHAFDAMAKLGRQYALGTDEGRSGLIAIVLPGRWSGARHAIVAKESKVPSTGKFVKYEIENSILSVSIYHASHKHFLGTGSDIEWCKR